MSGLSVHSPYRLGPLATHLLSLRTPAPIDDKRETAWDGRLFPFVAAPSRLSFGAGDLARGVVGPSRAKPLGGLGGVGDSGVSTRLFGSILKWLSDHESDAFVVATANDISKLPPEFARAERWDDFAGLFAFAGLWETWLGPDGAAVKTFTILTTTANDRVRPCHDRKPVIVAPSDFATWLDAADSTPDLFSPLRSAPSLFV